MEEYDMGDVKEYDRNTFAIEPEQLLNFIQFRRSVRQFKMQPVEDDKLLRIIEAGRFTATGGNRQNISYIVVRENIPQLRRLALEKLSEIAQAALFQSPQDLSLVSYAQRWTGMYLSDKEQPGKNDRLFYNAPIVFLIVADSPVDAALAASNMELMTVAQGLGTFYCGYFVRSAQGNPKISNLLGLADSQEVKVCMLLGYPNITYLRTVPRKPAQIFWR
jgi:nitroreductase